MDYPEWETPEDALRFDAVQLLTQAAQRVRSDWTVTVDNLDNVARVCRLTQGMPLGILLAMSWIEILSICDIAGEIERSLDFLQGNQRDLPERQQSIRAIFTTAWERLTEDEQTVFVKMSVFRGGFTREAAEAVTGASLKTLLALARKSLVMHDARTGRFDVHELLRQYAEEQLILRDPSTDSIYDVHARYYLGMFGELAPWFKGKGQKQALDATRVDFDNIQLAWHYASQHHLLDLLEGAVVSIDQLLRFIPAQGSGAANRLRPGAQPDNRPIDLPPHLDPSGDDQYRRCC